MNEQKCRRIVRERSSGGCEVRVLDVCLGRATNFQHRKNRGQGGRYDPSNGLDVCGSGTTGCHGYIHAHPEESYRKGWSVQSWADPAAVPFEHPDFGPVLLDDVGDLHLHREPAADFDTALEAS